MDTLPFPFHKSTAKDKEVSDNFRKFSEIAVKKLHIKDYNTSVQTTNNLIDITTEKFRDHPSISFNCNNNPEFWIFIRNYCHSKRNQYIE